MSYKVEIIADSVGPAGVRLTTFALMYPKMIHAELMTHRVFSRNASSTRAIPSKKMLQWVEDDPAQPVFWGQNQSGMSARSELADGPRFNATFEWFNACEKMLSSAKALNAIGLHKQIANRVIEPWMHINVLVSATNFGNWFTLRCHEDAQPEIQALAIRMLRAYLAAEPERVERGYWHLPYITDEERVLFNGRSEMYCVDTLKKISVARCCRVSYRTFDGTVAEGAADIDLHDKLLASGHWSPFEHQALCYSENPAYRSGNFHGGWVQYRQMLPTSRHSPSRQDLEAIAAKYGDRDYLA